MITQKRPDQQQCEQEPSFPALEQPEPALPLGSIYSDEEVLVLGPWRYYPALVFTSSSGRPPRVYVVESRTTSQSKSVRLCGVRAK